MSQIPQDFFREHVARSRPRRRSPAASRVGMVFLPRTDLGAQERCRTIVETRDPRRFGYAIYGWRQVPVDISVIGEKANATRPEIEQIMIAQPPGTRRATQFERDLYVIRRRIEKRGARRAASPSFYICSLSCRSVIYKGMFLAEQLTAFYPDLLDERFVSQLRDLPPALFDQHLPDLAAGAALPHARPQRRDQHAPRQRQLDEEPRDAHGRTRRSASYMRGPQADDPAGRLGFRRRSTTCSSCWSRGGRDAPMVKTHADPRGLVGNERDHARSAPRPLQLLQRVMEPWDGPAAIAATDGSWVVAGIDRNGLRPMRYTLTDDGLLIVGSETGMVRLDEDRDRREGPARPGPDDRRRSRRRAASTTTAS